MKTPEEIESTRWAEFENGVSMKDWIAAIQADARQGMVPAEELGPTVDILKWIKDGLQKNSLDASSISYEIARLEAIIGGKQP